MAIEQTEIRCKSCGYLFKNADPSSTKREPCIKFGSTLRELSVNIIETVKVRSSLEIKYDILNEACLLLQTIIIPESKITEGTLIKCVDIPWFRIIKEIQGNPELVFQLSSEKWEEMVAGAYKIAGFDEVILTPRSGDFGRDVIAIKKGLGQVRVIDQVKAYGPKHLVTANDVRALMGCLHEDGAAKGFLSTTSDFAPKITSDPLITPLIPQRLELINGKKLIERLIELSKKE
jgi:restriction system protein